MNDCMPLESHCEGRLLFITFEQDVAGMRIQYHQVCHDKSFTTSYHTTSALQYRKRALVKSEICACNEPRTTAH